MIDYIFYFGVVNRNEKHLHNYEIEDQRWRFCIAVNSVIC